ncbi:MAG TPA: hypothetical protein VLH86_03250 [Patescibacteria group bacterium]|nr:hypothetical protein [Patescibacteria group bacterium]
MNRQKIVGLLATGAILVTGLVAACSATASADSLAQATVTANCVDTTAQTVSWNVANNGPGTADIAWSTDATTNGSYTAPFGNSKFTTPYTGVTSDLTVSVAGQPAVTVPGTTDACVVPTTPCVDGTIRANLDFDWSEETGTVTLHTADDALLCDDVTVYLSTYTLPATYDESGIFDDSSLPQQHFASTSATLQKGTNGTVTLHVGIPNACTNFQMDLYYAPQIIDVPYTGHGAPLIYGNIHVRTATDCTPVNPGVGGGETTPPVTPPQTTPGAVLAASTVTPPAAVQSAHVSGELANTGTPLVAPLIAAVSLLVAACYVGFRRAPKTN